MIANAEPENHKDENGNSAAAPNSPGAQTATEQGTASSKQQSSSKDPAAPSTAPIKKAAETREFMHSRLISVNFGNIVTVLMQSPAHKNKRLCDLQDLVVPALLNNQFRVAEAHKKGSGYTIPVGLVFWAKVSKEVDERLSKTDSEDIKLSAKDWVSGDILWITEAVGEQRFVTSLLKDLVQKEFKGKEVKYRRKTKKGIEVAVLKV